MQKKFYSIDYRPTLFLLCLGKSSISRFRFIPKLKRPPLPPLVLGLGPDINQKCFPEVNKRSIQKKKNIVSNYEVLRPFAIDKNWWHIVQLFTVLPEAAQDRQPAVVDRQRAGVHRASHRGRGKQLRHRNHEQENDYAMSSPSGSFWMIYIPRCDDFKSIATNVAQINLFVFCQFTPKVLSP